jgi:hypothetical protein
LFDNKRVLTVWAYSLCFPYYIAGKEMAVDSVIFAANRIDPEIKFSKEACQMCVRIPMVDYAREKGWKLIDVPQLKEIQDKRSKEKNQRRH